MTAPVTRVEYVVRDRNGEEWLYPSKSGASGFHAYLVGQGDIGVTIIERTITERVLAPEEEG
jgi:hypothetical protein